MNKIIWINYIILLLQVLFACVAAASAQLVAYPNGAVAPAKTLEVQAAEAAHFAAHGYQYNGYNGLYNGLAFNGYANAYNGYANIYNGAYAYPQAYNNIYNPLAYSGLVAHPNGAIVPVDEPAVQQARAEHFAAAGLPIAPYAYAAGYSGLVAHPNGAIVPVESAEIQAARAEHLAAHAAA